MTFFISVGQPEDDALFKAASQLFRIVSQSSGIFIAGLLEHPKDELDWIGEGPLTLAPSERYFIIIGAVMNGFTAVLDDKTEFYWLPSSYKIIGQ